MFPPYGLGCFWTPAENYAIKTGTHPAITTAANIDRFREQLGKFGFAFDWNREIDTTNPDYYKWSQWIFLKLFEAGLAYESDKPINFCPSCKTGLANEEVVDGKCERCGTPVEKRPSVSGYRYHKVCRQTPLWYWPSWFSQRVSKRCRETGLVVVRVWISKQSERHGYHVWELQLCSSDLPCRDIYSSSTQNIRLFYELVKWTPQEKEVMDFLWKNKARKAAGKFDFEKRFRRYFTGRYVENFAWTGNDLPIWVASYILADYGTGIVNCSAHDVRGTLLFAKHDIPLHPVMFPADPVEAEKVRNLEYSVCKKMKKVSWKSLLFSKEEVVRSTSRYHRLSR